MSIEVDIIPTSNRAIVWSDLQSQLLLHPLADEARTLLGQTPVLLELGTNQQVEGKQALLPTKYYHFQLAHSNALTLSCERNSETYTNEQEYLEDFGRNLDSNLRAYISRCWAEVGYGYTVGSAGGRAKGEVILLAALAKDIASLSDSFIVIKEAGLFNLSVGVYSPDQFSQC
ncbi:hypothetical protein C7B65_12945 [Phormidesmis priestleyi ULC007]|uniref:Uncharacterized protein n=1 Tax=Phormidesmis priestleyi ULC007 TaxID=1920490 RepID=A0A2T1DFC3_9CYAN|nr:hypothetical protein [Phormidesmis priestleyi]PSB19176.1 hypothetical protein C7B65_12945 [Phormidesmis priestleyi ULC007]PZO50028.1 MAG: hypothetical protein DCF14_12890 [Phormidesmis priestleyi]